MTDASICVIELEPEPEPNNDDCPICMDKLVDMDKLSGEGGMQDIVTMSCCGKQMHINCYIQCVIVKNVCAFCRHELKTIVKVVTPNPILNDEIIHYYRYDVNTNTVKQFVLFILACLIWMSISSSLCRI